MYRAIRKGFGCSLVLLLTQVLSVGSGEPIRTNSLDASRASVLAQPISQAKTDPRPYVHENDALGLAALDLATLSREDRLYARYVWVTNADEVEMKLCSLGINMVSRATVISLPIILGREQLMLLRLDLRRWFPRPEDLAEAIKTWEEFRFDPRFNLLLTKDTLDLTFGLDLVKVQTDPPRRGKRKVPRLVEKIKSVPPFVHTDGKTYNAEWVKETIYDEVEVELTGFEGLVEDGQDVARVVGEHLDKRLVATLVQQTFSQAPVVSHRYFLQRLLTTVQDKGVYRTIWGGLYYQFAGIKKGAKKGTDEDNFFEALGVGNVSQGITAAKIFDRLRSDQRIALFRSGVTGKPRRADLFHTLAARPEYSQSIVGVTHDLFDEDVDVGRHPLLNLLDFKDRAREVIFEKANGLHGFALFNDAGALQDEVPFNVANDTTIPKPHTQRLQCAIGCLRCHGPEDGWKILHNDVTRLLDRRRGLDVFDEFNAGGATTFTDQLDRLGGLYSGNLELKALPRARQDYAQAFLRATVADEAGSWRAWKSEQAQADVVRLGSDAMGRMYNRHVYDMVDAKEALSDLGIISTKEEAAGRLTKLLPPIGKPIVRADGLLYWREDARIGALKNGLGISRTDYDLCYGFLAYRVMISKGAKR